MKILSLKYKSHHAQATLEFTFAMVAVLVLAFGLIQAFFWVGKELAFRRQAHERALTEDIGSTCGYSSSCPLRQVRPVFFGTAPMDAAVDSDLFE